MTAGDNHSNVAYPFLDDLFPDQHSSRFSTSLHAWDAPTSTPWLGDEYPKIGQSHRVYAPPSEPNVCDVERGMREWTLDAEGRRQPRGPKRTKIPAIKEEAEAAASMPYTSPHMINSGNHSTHQETELIAGIETPDGDHEVAEEGSDIDLKDVCPCTLTGHPCNYQGGQYSQPRVGYLMTLS